MQAYIRALRKAGTPVNVNIVLAAAEGAVTAVDGTLLKKNGGTFELKRPWEQSLMQQMKFVKCINKYRINLLRGQILKNHINFLHGTIVHLQ